MFDLVCWKVEKKNPQNLKRFSEYSANIGVFAEIEDVMQLLIILSFAGGTSCCDEKWTSAHIWPYNEWVRCCDCIYKLVMYASVSVRNKRLPKKIYR